MPKQILGFEMEFGSENLNQECSQLFLLSLRYTKEKYRLLILSLIYFVFKNMLFQSLDYESCESEIFKTEHCKKSPWSLIRQSGARWVVMFFIGVCTALIACTIDICVAEISKLKYGFLKQCNFIYT